LDLDPRCCRIQFATLTKNYAKDIEVFNDPINNLAQCCAF
jgi:hypothetical protein